MPTEVPQSNIDTFINDTCLLPHIVLDGVVDEVFSFLNAKRRDSSQVWDALRSAEMEANVSERTARAYEGDPTFSALMRREDPRPAYYSYMRHWVAAEIKKRFPQHYELLPSSFSLGAPLPR